MRKVSVIGRIREERGLETYITDSGKKMEMPIIKKFHWEKFDAPVAGTLYNPIAGGAFKEKVFLVMSELYGMMLVPESWIIED